MPIGTDQDEPPQRLPGISSNANPPKPGIVVVGKNNMPKKNCQVATYIFHQSNAFNRISTQASDACSVRSLRRLSYPSVDVEDIQASLALEGDLLVDSRESGREVVREEDHEAVPGRRAVVGVLVEELTRERDDDTNLHQQQQLQQQ